MPLGGYRGAEKSYKIRTMPYTLVHHSLKTNTNIKNQQTNETTRKLYNVQTVSIKT